MGHSAVMLSEAKHLSAQRDRPFASLRVTVEGPIMDFQQLIGIIEEPITVEVPISSSVLFFETA